MRQDHPFPRDQVAALHSTDSKQSMAEHLLSQSTKLTVAHAKMGSH